MKGKGEEYIDVFDKIDSLEHGCKNKIMIHEAYDYADKARIAILAIFQYKDYSENIDIIQYFYDKANDSIRALYKSLRKLLYNFDGKACKYASDEIEIMRKSLDNTDIILSIWENMPSFKGEFKYGGEYCSTVRLVMSALERIEDVVRELETLIKLIEEDSK